MFTFIDFVFVCVVFLLICVLRVFGFVVYLRVGY